MLTMWVQIGTEMCKVARVVNYFGLDNAYATVEVCEPAGMRIAVATAEIEVHNG